MLLGWLAIYLQNDKGASPPSQLLKLIKMDQRLKDKS